jgi:hypothetical protein
MLDCVTPCDFVGYLKSKEPTSLPGSQCAKLGFVYQAMDNIYPEVSLYWKAGHVPTMGDFFGPYFKNHTQCFAYLNATRDATPACRMD